MKNELLNGDGNNLPTFAAPPPPPTLKANRVRFQSLEQFTEIVNQPPPVEGIRKTPDGKAEHLAISYIETLLDEVYLRQWGANDVNIQIVANEILVWLTLWVIDPITGVKIERPGFAAVQITVDAVPDNIKENKKLKNEWALNLQNKKPNACYLSFPKAKSAAIKNAAQTLGKRFGRDINRTIEDTPEGFYEPEFKAMEERDFQKRLDGLAEDMKQCKTLPELEEIWNSNPDLHTVVIFRKYVNSFKSQLKLKA